MAKTTIDVDPEVIDADGIVANGSTASTSVTLNGALISGGAYTASDGLGHQLSITDTGADDQSTATFTITGTDADGNAQTESLAGPTSSGTVETTKYFKTVSSISIASPVATSTANIGTVDEVASPTLKLSYARCEAGMQTVVTGTVNYSVQETMMHGSPVFVSNSTFATKTADVLGVGTAHAAGVRVIFNSFTDGAEVQLHVNQEA